MGILPLVEDLSRRALRMRGVESRYVTTKVARQHVYEARLGGALPPIVVLHGVNSSASAFAEVLARLAPRHRVLFAPDAPGHGFSDEPRVPLTPATLFDATAELLDAVLDEPAIVFGNSLGGAMALSYALARPEKVRGLFLASPAGAQDDEAGIAAFLKSFELGSRADADVFLGKLYHRKPWFTRLVASDIHRLFARDFMLGFFGAVKPENLFTKEQLATLAMPVRFLWGRSERLMPPRHLAFYKQSLPPHAEILEPEGIGHCPHLDDPKALVRMIEEFAKRV